MGEPQFNPFTVVSPEKLTADQVMELFVEMPSELNQVMDAGHMMIVGARGAGKSMIFRYLLPDVQTRLCDGKYKQIPFLAFHIPIKNAQLHLPELAQLDNAHAAALINEHFLVLYCLIIVLKDIMEVECCNLDELPQKDLETFVNNCFLDGLFACGCNTEIKYEGQSGDAIFGLMYRYALRLHSDFLRFVVGTKPGMSGGDIHYDLPLLSYHMFLIPFLRGCIKLLGLGGKNVYLLMDDADNLSITQTKILNTWLSSRTAPEISLKVASQIGKYKTYLNVNGVFVEAPHDYQELNLFGYYTKDYSRYIKHVREIATRRLSMAGINVTAEDFFEECKEQEMAIKGLVDEIRNTGKCDGRICRPNEANEYARANYIRSLGENKNVRSSYRYAGFNQLAWLSSGVIRYFLDAAATMFDLVVHGDGGDGESGKQEQHRAQMIPFMIQDFVIRARAEDRMFFQFAKLSIGTEGAYAPTIVAQLQNLVRSLGETFHNRLVSSMNERRVFSIALSRMPTSRVRDVLDFGVETGYLHGGAIGNKSGSGKTWLYGLNKSLAPHFGLDPIGVAGYISVTNESLMEAINSGKPIRESNIDETQMELFPVEMVLETRS